MISQFILSTYPRSLSQHRLQGDDVNVTSPKPHTQGLGVGSPSWGGSRRVYAVPAVPCGWGVFAEYQQRQGKHSSSTAEVEERCLVGAAQLMHRLKEPHGANHAQLDSPQACVGLAVNIFDARFVRQCRCCSPRSCTLTIRCGLRLVLQPSPAPYKPQAPDPKPKSLL